MSLECGGGGGGHVLMDVPVPWTHEMGWDDDQEGWSVEMHLGV